MTGSAEAAIEVTRDTAINNFPVGGAVTGNASDVVELAPTDYTQDSDLKDFGVLYVQREDVNVYGTVLEIDPGVEYQFAANRTPELGWNSREAEVEIVGTEVEPFVFHGSESEPGYRHGLFIIDERSRHLHAFKH